MDNDLIPKDGGFSSKMTVVVGSIKLQGHCLGFCAGEITHVVFHCRCPLHSEEVDSPLEYGDIQGVKAYTRS